MILAVSCIQLIVGLFSCISGSSRDSANRVVVRGNKAKIKFPMSKRAMRKVQKVLACHFEIYQCFGADVYSKMRKTKSHSFMLIFLAWFLKLWCKAFQVSCLELLAFFARYLVYLSWSFLFLERLILSSEAYLPSLSTWVNSGLS